ncbi:hypothetical protein FLK61_23455 [Paenalkalicoccus suaedae]|uniref:Sensory rhodopsin transducer n=1 Tax=Paenalkalicoccus suaedae TaxID=2592382 RepID=A0A859FBT8_9BACI|nr:sensory rhodopsin transducer [Paenalkalicoccus suaedae]QKS69755.1 hypothetical protein FLK61_23455 [Paenalkalicoccus suaedae]
MSQGKKTWYIPDGFIPPESSGRHISHEAICVLNDSGHSASLTMTVYFEDQEPIRDLTATVENERTAHIKTNELKNQNGATIPVGVPYAMKVEANTDIIVQYSRLDSTQPELALMSTIAY